MTEKKQTLEWNGPVRVATAEEHRLKRPGMYATTDPEAVSIPGPGVVGSPRTIGFSVYEGPGVGAFNPKGIERLTVVR